MRGFHIAQQLDDAVSFGLIGHQRTNLLSCQYRHHQGAQNMIDRTTKRKTMAPTLSQCKSMRVPTKYIQMNVEWHSVIKEGTVAG
jgi:hypothetical protein